MNQLQILRHMTGEKRLEQAIQLSELTRDLAFADIKKQLGKKASKKTVIREFQKRLQMKSNGTARNTSSNL